MPETAHRNFRLKPETLGELAFLQDVFGGLSGTDIVKMAIHNLYLEEKASKEALEKFVKKSRKRA
jgi:hypothetical protein